MTGLMRRILRRRGTTSDQAQLEAQEPETEAQDTAPFPAGADPDEAAAAEPPSFRHRGKMRRRLRYLRRERELGFRDLGGLVFDLRRFGRNRPDLVDAKIAALFEVDQELRALEVALDDRRPFYELREPGIASCPRCGALHGSEARFCPACGLPLRGPQAVAEVGESLPGGAIGPAVAPPPTPRPALPPATGPHEGGRWARPQAERPAPPSSSGEPPARARRALDEPAPFGDEPTGGQEPGGGDGEERGGGAQADSEGKEHDADGKPAERDTDPPTRALPAADNGAASEQDTSRLPGGEPAERRRPNDAR
jgi:zinc-ribbon domain